MEENNYK